MPFKLGLFDGLGLQKTAGVKVNIHTPDSDLAGKLRDMVQKMFDFGQGIGKDSLETVADSDKLHGLETIALVETVLGYCIRYVTHSQESVSTFGEDNRRTQGLGHLLPPEGNSN